jgi:hypothetical protein
VVKCITNFRLKALLCGSNALKYFLGTPEDSINCKSRENNDKSFKMTNKISIGQEKLTKHYLFSRLIPESSMQILAENLFYIIRSNILEGEILPKLNF